MANGAPECLFFPPMAQMTLLNAFIIYKAPLAESWNPEPQAPGFAVCGTDSKSIRDCWCSWFIVYEQRSFLPNKCLVWFINEIHSSFIFWENSQSAFDIAGSGLIEWMVLHYIALLSLAFKPTILWLHYCNENGAVHSQTSNIPAVHKHGFLLISSIARQMGMMNN